ncbi:transcription factor cwo [Contarinia nasturtii]|uniref:transcription factor cwo n=1 Tax=Contarinia nasturtii TaxID=265458 RepID=UPI0012D47FB5|nr:transcription factor cwo [Contarinia nasturtii]XP_031618549.1 transcription factor cwo [Contarinia nasturtii]
MEPMWEQNNHIAHQVKYESDAALPGFSYCGDNGLNFSTNSANYSEDDADFAPGRRNKPSRQDPLSHRIIEKRRRDRMNSCLADLSRLIPPQFQRKGRGRIEKTEIIEMSIRYMKQLQNQECLHKENVYRMGYDECLQQAANFLYNTHREICFQLMDHLKEHSNDFMKADFCKLRSNNADSVSASSGSPPTNVYHNSAPMNQLRNMLLTDMEHSNSNDHNDVKDLSFRSNQPQQAAVITSTAPPIVHLDSSNHDFDSSRASSVHADTEVSNEKTDGTTIQSVRVRKLSESSHPDHEHHNNYKFKNYIQQRFSQDNNSHHDDHNDDTTAINLIHENGQTIEKGSSMEHETATPHAKRTKFYDFAECSSCDETKPTTNGITEFKSEPLTNGYQMFPKPNAANNTTSRFPHNPVPIFALHSQGRHYVPLAVDYDTLVPYLDGFDLVGKNCTQMPPCHSVSISVNFSPPNRTKLTNVVCNNNRTKNDSLVCNGW